MLAHRGDKDGVTFLPNLSYASFLVFPSLYGCTPVLLEEGKWKCQREYFLDKIVHDVMQRDCCQEHMSTVKIYDGKTSQCHITNK